MRRRVAVVAAALAGMGVVLVVVSNVILAGVVEGRLSRVTGLEWKVTSARWSPWGGLRFRGLSGALKSTAKPLPGPICEVAEIRLRPYWGSLLRGRAQFREIEVKTPKGRIPIEMLAALARTSGVTSPPSHEISLDPPKDPPKPRTGEKKTERKNRADKKRPGREQARAEDGEKEATPPPAPPEKPKSLPSRVRISGGSLRIYSLGNPALEVAIPDFSCDVPVGGPEGEGEVSHGGVLVAGRMFAPPMRESVSWDGTSVLCKRTIRTRSGLDLVTVVRVGTGRSPRFAFASRVENPSMALQPLPGLGGTRIGVERIRAAFLRGEGHLTRPRTWEGDLVVDTRGIVVEKAVGETVHRFDFGQCVAVLRRGVLHVPDARLRSERLSLLGNGLVLPDGRQQAVVRVVADEEISNVIRRVVIGANLSRGWTSAWMKPLVTPDRRYRDINIGGKLPHVTADLGRKGERMEVGEALALLRRFLEEETRESQAAAHAGAGGV